MKRLTYKFSNSSTDYYLAYGINHMAVPDAERLWGIVGLVVLFSILMHGLTVTPVMRSLDRQQGRDPDTGLSPPADDEVAADQSVSSNV